MNAQLKYVVVCQQLWCSPAGQGVDYNVDEHQYDHQESAIRRGYKLRGSDDFNIAVVRAGRLISWNWMGEKIDEDNSVMNDIAAALGVEWECS